MSRRLARREVLAVALAAAGPAPVALPERALCWARQGFPAVRSAAGLAALAAMGIVHRQVEASAAQRRAASRLLAVALAGRAQALQAPA